MQDVSAASVRLVFHRDDKTPAKFVVSLFQTVFAKSEREVRAVTAKMSQHGEAACGPYPAVVAKA